MDATSIFDAMNAFSDEMHRRIRQQEEFERLRESARPHCGGCYWWMKSRDCPRERNVGGISRGPGSGASPCAKFTASAAHARAIEKYAAAKRESL